MSCIGSFTRKPIVYAIGAAAISPMLLLSQQVLAIPVPVDKVIDSTTVVQSYELNTAGVTLTSSGASTLDITARSGTSLMLDNTQVVATGSDNGVALLNADAIITNSTINSGAGGLTLGNSGGNVGSTAVVTGSQISGARTGAVVNEGSVLTLVGSSVTGTGTDSRGVQFFGGTVKAANSTISGGTNGIRMLGGPVSPVPLVGELVLDNTSVQGLTGAAISIGEIGAAASDIKILNGSTLTGGNGNILEVGAGSSASMLVDGSHLVGNVIVESGSTASLTLDHQATLTGRLENVSSLSLDNSGQWVMVENSQIGDLSMSNGGSVKFGDPGSFYTLSVASLKGNGTFVMDADFSAGQTDFLEVTGQATGNHSLLVGSSGTDPKTDSQLHIVNIGSGDAQFSLANGRVDLGTYSYDLIQKGNDWYLASTGTISPGTSSVLALFNTAPTVWYGEMTTLRSRMGEIRQDQGSTGLWMRSYGNKFNVSESSGLAYKQQQQGLSFGADAPLPFGDGRWLVGLMGGYSKSDLDVQQGTSGTVDSYYVGAYTTWINESGYYFDGVLKFNRFQNESKISLSDGERAKGDYDNSGVGASLEVGRHVKLENDYFVEPYVQLSGVIIQGKHYDLDNGMTADGDRTRSLLGKLGATAGRNFYLSEGRVVQPYVRAAWVQEFAKNNEVEVNATTFNNDLSGARAELGVGLTLSMTERLHMYADVEYSNGEKIEQPYGFSVGVRYNW